MGKYKCLNPKCSQYNIEVKENTHIFYGPDGRVDRTAPCPECKEIREMISDGFPTVLANGNPNICNK